MKTLPRTKGIDLLPLPVWTMLTQKARRNYHVFITSDLFSKMHLTLRRLLKVCYLPENKLAEACASRTHRRHQGCRPPVLKTGRITGPHSLPRQRPTMFPVTRAGEPEWLARNATIWVEQLRAGTASVF